jgi:sulfoxide reductase heme-binding subunit YedZ
MNKVEELTWTEVAIFAAGSLIGALLGVWALIGLAAAMTANAPGFWFVSRAAGIVAYIALWVATAWGVMLSARDIGTFVSKPLRYALHTITSWLALGFAAIHGLALLGDRVVPFTAPGVLVPFAANYQPQLSGLGTLSLYVGILVSVTFYWKKRIGYRAWRAIHLLSYLMFAAVTLHGAMLGTDSSTPIMQAVYMTAGGSVLFLTLYRVLTAGADRAGAIEPRSV